MVAAIIVAAGSGMRMNASRPKQYLDMDGFAVLSRTVRAFDEHSAVEKIFLVVSSEEMDYCRSEILSIYEWRTRITLLAGGKTRQESVFAGLKAAEGEIAGDDVVLIHDGVRPFVSSGLITACIEGARRFGACVPGLLVTDTLKRASATGFVTGTQPRDEMWTVQTPQAFLFRLIRDGFEHVVRSGACVTDDAAVVEYYGKPVKIIPGCRRNIKLTTQDDLSLARRMLAGDRIKTKTSEFPLSQE